MEAIEGCPERPSPQQDGRGGNRDRRSSEARVYRARVRPHWFANNTRFWYRNDLRGGGREFIAVDTERGTRERAFDHDSAARQIGDGFDGARLPVDELQFSEDMKHVTLIGRSKSWRLELASGKLEENHEAQRESAGNRLVPEARARPSARAGAETEITFDNRLARPVEIFWLDDRGRRQSYGAAEPNTRKEQHTFGGHVWLVADAGGETLAVFEATDQPGVAVIDGAPPQPRPTRSRSERRRREGDQRSPDGIWTAVIKEHNLFVRAEGEEEYQLSTDGSLTNGYGSFTWSPDSKTLVAWRTEPGDRKQVHLIRSAPEEGGRAQLESRAYALPGDKFSKHELNLFNVATRKHIKPSVDRFEHEWASPRIHWDRGGGRLKYQQVDRGHQRLRVIEVDVSTGEVRNIIDETSRTFIWTVHLENSQLELVNWLEKTDEIIYVSERDGWRRLYLVDAAEGKITNPMTESNWVVRGIERIDEDARQIWFSASGRNPGQDPYFLHQYRVNFDGTELVALTDGDGTHTIEFSPDRRFLIDTWSRADAAPAHTLRRTCDGSLVCKLEIADISELEDAGWVAPEPFVAKGRDGKTDIFGLIHRPRNLDPSGKYPVIESIYAGPQGSFVPKSFRSNMPFESLTDLGFIVVQIDGMGTANRSKSFHDVCHKNLKDGGFPDRILWMKAAAARYPYIDLSRVGIYEIGRAHV